ncbi:putative large ATP-binding protein [Streptomyces himastatinicus ATCC 53653]|uniref:Putative large ATP-binding protein n=1 Tax=Streptomyces himastatinicus ATCC 53653 TaxID=457427 RepID=D9WSY8_9ACTN|nr:NACHT domain-containing protein [Streptomyces himastatinicus]EFL24263.1 putative large ATP-binding protein [Streptomyces himastatinicus ATCC 53653]
MDPAVIGARLASSAVAPLVKKLFVREGPGAGLVDRPVRISSLVSFRGEKRTLTDKDLRKLAAELVERAMAGAGPGERPIPADEAEPLTDALAKSLHSLGDLTMDDVQAVRFGHRVLAKDLHYKADLPDAQLSLNASRLYRNLLDTACLHILHFFTQRSTFVARTLVEQSGQLTELITKIDILIERLPSQSAQDAAFERRYADYTALKHGTLTIVGIDLSHSEATWPLDAAYLSLEAVSQDEHIPGLDGAPLTALPADRALSGHERVLLRGVAGSGKTTLVQWLAVSAARQEPPRGLEQLIGRVPFVLPLRTIARQDALPSPARFLASVHNPLDAAQPTGWADRVLTAGRGLLLIDGIDEIPERDRERTRAWLADLLLAYPGNLWLVTSRPSAVADDWLAAQDFSEFALSPMNRDDMAAFIDRWHDAARVGCRTDDERAALATYQSALHTAVRTKQDLTRLATNPLMCGLICALHRARRGYLPPGRKALYDAALSMLLTRRDTERHVYAPGDIQLDEEPQIQLLQRLAYYLIRNGEAELDRERAEAIVAEALPSVPAAQALGDAPRILNHLLLRSGLLREPSVGTVEFVHRTFQDYLGAKAAVEAWDVGLLVNNAHDSQWEDVFRMSVAHARPRERAELLGKLLDLARKNSQSSLRLFLLAMACLDHAPDLDPEIREEVTRHGADFIPPLDVQRAREMATVGPLVLELLPQPDGLTDDQAHCCVVTASRIGTDAAIPYLSQFADHRALAVRSQLASSWAKFDTDRYFTEVILRLDRKELYFVAESMEHLRLLHDTGPRPMLVLRGDFTDEQLSTFLDPSHLTLLQLEKNTALHDLGFLRNYSRLRHLILSFSPLISDLSPLADLALRDLYLFTDRDRPGFSGLEHLTALEHLTIRENLLPKHPLPQLSRLTLVSSGSVIDLERVLRAFPGLRHLHIKVMNADVEPVDLTPLRDLDHRLETVSVAGAPTIGDDQIASVRLTSSDFV